jgi:hypothetical protein
MKNTIKWNRIFRMLLHGWPNGRLLDNNDILLIIIVYERSCYSLFYHHKFLFQQYSLCPMLMTHLPYYFYYLCYLFLRISSSFYSLYYYYCYYSSLMPSTFPLFMRYLISMMILQFLIYMFFLLMSTYLMNGFN